ncbi:MAG: RNA polymerase sigma factor [Acidobacteria bacterium]|nr:RNA polymerase sigma factor [Acidobacteriota bacterium]
MSLRDTPDRERLEHDEPATNADRDANAVRDAVRAVRQGDAQAYALVVERYQRRLFSLALMLTRQPPAAEEVAQDAFVRAFTHLGAYDEHRPFYPWLATIAVRLAQNWLAQRARVVAHEGHTPVPDLDSATATDPLSALITDERDRRLWRLVAALPSGERAAVILYYRQEMSVGDIARAFGVTNGTVKTYLFRARQRLRRSAGSAPQRKDGQ